MNVSSGKPTLDRIASEFARSTRDVLRDIEIWVARLDDVEKMFFIVMFIFLLFMLILVRSASRPRDPSSPRSFVSSLLLVIVFSFSAGWIIDSRFEIPFNLADFF